LYKELLNFCTVDLSAFYFDIRKDCLYCDPKDSEKRNSVLILLNIILNSLLKWFAPILSFTTEEIFQLVTKNDKSIHLEEFLKYPKKFENFELNEKWTELLKIRDICNLSIEEKRSNKEIGSSLEAELEISLNEKLFEISKNIDFSELCITSKFTVKKIDSNEIIVKSKKADGKKCSICWKVTSEKCKRPSCSI